MRTSLLALTLTLVAVGALLVLALRPDQDPEPATVRRVTVQEEPSGPGHDAHVSIGSEATRSVARPPEHAPEVQPRSTPAKPDDEPSLEVRITTVESGLAGGRPLGNVEVAVGLGNAEAPIEEALATVTTDGSGHATVALPSAAVAAARAEGDRLWARPTGLGGWAEIHAQRRMPAPDSSEVVELRVTMLRGSTARGRLTTRDGQPSAGWVQAFAPGTPAEGAMVESDGRLVLHFDAPGTYDLVAVGLAEFAAGEPSPGGSAVLRGVEVSMTQAPQDLDLRLGGDGVLRGRVEDGNGRPVAGLGLQIISEHTSPDVIDPTLRLRLMLEAAGALDANLHTDEQGAFEARGLRTDRYRLFGNRRELLPLPVPADGEPLVVIYDRPHLVVRVVEPDGEPWSGQLAHQLRPRPRREPGAWAPAPRLVVSPTAQAIDAARWGAQRWSTELRGAETGDGALRYDVEPDRSYLVGLLGGELEWRPLRIDVPPGAGRMEVAVTAHPAPGRGTVELTVTDAEGPLASGFEVLVEDADSGRLLLEGAGDREPSSPARLELPAGRLRVAVEGRAGIGLQHGTVHRRSAHGRAEQVVDLQPGGTLPVALQLPAGARIDLELVGQRLPADREAVEAWLGEGRRESEVDSWVSDAEVWLLAEGHWPRGVDFFHEDERPWVGSYLSPYLPIGTRQVSEPVPAGRWRLEARMPGGRTASRELTLVDGETAVVKLEL